MNHEPLDSDQIEHFLKFGFVKIAGAIDCSPGSLAGRWIEDSWKRNGIPPHDRSAWPNDKIHMPNTESGSVEEMAPSAYAAIAQLCGGIDRISGPLRWSNGFVANYGWGRDKPWIAPGPDAPGWHVDGDFFVHFLDSAEQALLVVALYSDVHPKGGATFAACDSVAPVAKFLASHPEGVEPGGFPRRELMAGCRDFREMTGNAGDVVLMHPFTLHASSYNHRPEARLMTNPVVKFREPMQFADPQKCCPVERAILRGLGVERLDFKPTSERRTIVPGRIARQQKLAEAENARMSGAVV